MRKIIIFTIVLLIIPFLIVSFFAIDYKDEIVEEIKLNYISNVVVRVYREEDNVIDNVMLEEYIVGVLAGEMPVSFDIEALKAQAVASRSYVLNKINNSKDLDYDVVDSVMNQVYLDTEYLKSVWKDRYIEYINKLRMAVNETSMEYLEYDGEVINAMYFSTSNGYTENSEIIFGKEVPYLVSVESLWDKDVSSVFNDSKTISLLDFYTKLNLSYNKNLNISDIISSDTGRVISLKINGVNLRASELYQKLGLRSYDFKISLVGSNVLIETKGYGHGVGMSQYGAHGMAIDGYSYDEILKYYYTGANLVKLEV